MKKLFLFLCATLVIFSVTLNFSCETNTFCCQDQHASSSQCFNCTSHVESSYDIKSLPSTITLLPNFLGQIFFRHIHTKTIDVVFRFERPPTLFA